METRYWKVEIFGMESWVRTSVVWKLDNLKRFITSDNCWVRTSVVWKLFFYCIIKVLYYRWVRTSVVWKLSSLFQIPKIPGWVRTSVVWKLEIPYLSL